MSGGGGKGGGNLAGPVLLGLLGLFSAWDHLSWLKATSAPIAKGDGPRHALFALSRAQDGVGGALNLGLLLEPTYYPSLVPWLATPLLQMPGASGYDYRGFLALFTGLLVFATGMLARRLLGTELGLAAGALVLTVPILWPLRADVMLDGPLAAMVVLFLACLPRPEGHLLRYLGCGLVLGLGLLTKQTMPYLAAPALAVVGLPVLWRSLPKGPVRSLGLFVALGALAIAAILYTRGQAWPALGIVLTGTLALSNGAFRPGVSEDRQHLGKLAMMVLVALLLAGPWYVLSVGPILEGLEITRASHADVPPTLSEAGALRIASTVLFVFQEMLPWPHVLAALVGLGSLYWTAGKRPLLWAVAATFLGGTVLISTFPDLHVRHFAPVVGPLLVLAVTPLVLLPEKVMTAVATLVAALGILAGLSWRSPEAVPPAWRAGASDAHAPQGLVAADWGELGLKARRLPGNLRAFAMVPPEDALPLRQAVIAMARDRDAASRRSSALLLSEDPAIEAEGLQLEVQALGLDGLVAVMGSAEALVRELPPEFRAAYAVDLVSAGGAGEEGRGGRGRRGRYAPSPALERLGFEELGRWPARLEGGPGDLELVLYRYLR